MPILETLNIGFLHNMYPNMFVKQWMHINIWLFFMSFACVRVSEAKALLVYPYPISYSQQTFISDNKQQSFEVSKHGINFCRIYIF